MSYFNTYQSQIVEEVLSKFRQAGALSKETAMSLDDLDLFPKQNPNHKIGLNYLKSMQYIRKVKNSFYLDQDALSNPTKTLFKRFVVLFFILFPIMILILAIMVILHEYNII